MTTRPTPSTTTSRARVTPTGRPGLARARALRVAGAAAAGLAVWILAVPVLGIELAARSGDGTLVVGPVSVAGAGVLAGLAAWSLLALLERITVNARTVWTIIASVGLVLSFVGPLVQGATSAAALSLAAMHLAVGTAIIGPMGSTARPQGQTEM